MFFSRWMWPTNFLLIYQWNICVWWFRPHTHTHTHMHVRKESKFANNYNFKAQFRHNDQRGHCVCSGHNFAHLYNRLMIKSQDLRVCYMHEPTCAQFSCNTECFRGRGRKWFCDSICRSLLPQHFSGNHSWLVGRYICVCRNMFLNTSWWATAQGREGCSLQVLSSG